MLSMGRLAHPLGTAHEVSDEAGIMGAMARSMDKRRAEINHSSDDEDDGSSSDSGWSSDG